MTVEFYQQFANLLNQGDVVLATVTQVRGSVPREVGAKMLIWGEGYTFNTIGGGAGEGKVISKAMEVLKTGEKQFVEIDLSGAPQEDTQGVCGGLMQVWLERWSGENAIALIQQIITALTTYQTITLVIPFEPLRHPYLLPTSPSDATLINTFIETLKPPPLLLIIGAGHIGQKLAKLAHFIGFKVAVQDNRSEFANLELFPEAAFIFTESLDLVLEALPTLSNLYIVLVTRGYQYDLEALIHLFKKSTTYPYIGMIGSKKRVRMVYQELELCGVLPELLQQIHAPIGLEIGALTPEEIAVSICAELIHVRRCGNQVENREQQIY